MKTNIYRTIFFVGLITFVYSIYTSFTNPQSTEHDLVFLVLGFWIFFLIYLTIFAFYHFLLKSPQSHLHWLAILFIPVIGAYLYFEKFIVPDKFEKNPIWKLNPRPDCSEDEIIRTLKRRSVAAIIDYGIFALLYVVFISKYGLPRDVNTIHSTLIVLSYGSKQVADLSALPIIIGWFLYFPMSEFIFGQTLGKWLLRIKVVIGDGTKVSFVGSLRRHILDLADIFYFFFVGVVRVRRKTILPRRLGDYWGHTWIILKQPPNQALH